MAKGKKGKKGSRKSKGMKKPTRRRGRSRRRGMFGIVPMPSVKDALGSGFLIAMDVVDATVIDLPNDIHPWAAGLMEAGIALKDAGVIKAAYMVEIAHLCREHEITAKAIEKAAEITGKLLGTDNSQGGGALSADELIAIQARLSSRS